MISKHESFTWPETPDQKLWRYMDLAKFLSALQTESFWLTRSDMLGDPFEGSIPRATVEEEARTLREHGIDIAAAGIAEGRRWFLTQVHVSCWHLSDHESAAMWRLYSQANEAICVQSTFDRIARNLPSSMYAGLVSYIDYETGVIPTDNLFYAFTHKRKSFEHERELRFIAWTQLAAELGGDELRKWSTDAGIAWPLRPSDYIEAVYISPLAPPWFTAVVQRIVADAGLDIPVRQSALNQKPLY